MRDLDTLERETKSGKYTNLTYKFMTNPKFLMLAYHSIKNKPGNMTTGTSPETLDGITEQWFYDTAKRIQQGS